MYILKKLLWGDFMGAINEHVGKQIRMYRKSRKMTLQELADQIHKSRASVSKYENGEISLDIETLYEIAEVLKVSPNQLMNYQPPAEVQDSRLPAYPAKSPFFEARRLYFYFYDGRYNRLKDGIIDIYEMEDQPGHYQATLSISSVTAAGRSSETYYSGRVMYSDMLIRFQFVNQSNSLEEDLLYIFNPLERRDYTEGLLCGISSADLMPCAFKCRVTLTPQEHTETLKNQLLISKKELQRWQKLNMLIVDNRGD